MEPKKNKKRIKTALIAVIAFIPILTAGKCNNKNKSGEKQDHDVVVVDD